MLMMFQEMKSGRAHAALPQSSYRPELIHTGGSIVAKSSMISFHPSPQLIRKSKMSDLGTSRKLMLLFSIPPNFVRPNAWFIAIA